ncbi:caspase family protein [Pontibacter akesuensis]|uniref:Caspase domain-containing protein n=2 Tax=Pontibacter akesuensis TaxID=388950 RepID=A0A1I7JCI4_9BACT|nr:caspase family protein [Pontibacter akesuensis]GHA70990.1 hypothetical protein GCM10007389_25530 [Pontibacter akesuensis]SFU82858.1 Caspase domain-containing protein [Pontibacter akesuensis]
MAVDFALLIGINHYPEYHPLSGAHPDVEAMFDWLKDPNGGGIEDTSRIVTVLSNDSPVEPLHDEVDKAFEEVYKKAIINPESCRRFYFYFSGHGIGLQSDDDNGLCMANWSEFRPASVISSEEYRSEVVKSGLFEEVIFLLDCCRSRSLNRRGLFPLFSWLPKEEGPVSTRYIVGYATLHNDESFESQQHDKYRGHFTTALLNGLKGGAARNGQITLHELQDYVRSETIRLSEQTGMHQQARFRNSGFDQATFRVLFNSVMEKKIRCNFDFGSGIEGKYLLINGATNSSIDEWENPTGVISVHLDPVFHAIVYSADRSAIIKSVFVEAGKEVINVTV